METKQKRFSFGGFSSLSRSLSLSSKPKQPVVDDRPRPTVTKRDQKTQSLYIKSFRKPETTYNKSEAVQQNSKDVRNTIRRSLSAVIYASPHSSSKKTSSSSSSSDGGGGNGNTTSTTLVPVLVTPELSDSVGGILLETPKQNKEAEEKEEKEKEEQKKKKKVVEYDNSMEIMRRDGKATIVWQGYGYMLNSEQQGLEDDFEPEVWEAYRGLVHPLHLFSSMEERWQELSVTELRRYYDNYGSMMLKIRESRMKEQQRQYRSSTIKSDWIIPPIS